MEKVGGTKKELSAMFVENAMVASIDNFWYFHNVFPLFFFNPLNIIYSKLLNWLTRNEEKPNLPTKLKLFRRELYSDIYVNEGGIGRALAEVSWNERLG